MCVCVCVCVCVCLCVMYIITYFIHCTGTHTCSCFEITNSYVEQCNKCFVFARCTFFAQNSTPKFYCPSPYPSPCNTFAILNMSCNIRKTNAVFPVHNHYRSLSYICQVSGCQPPAFGFSAKTTFIYFALFYIQFNFRLPSSHGDVCLD